MHSLEVIILRNARTAGREQAHADQDTGRTTLTTLEQGLVESIIPHLAHTSPVVAAYLEGYAQGQRDDTLENGG